MCADCEFEDFIFECEALKERIEEVDNESDAWVDFSSGVLDKTMGMKKWAEENQHCTDLMRNALLNMEGGVARWER